MKPRLYGSGQAIREWTHVDDHNQAVLQILAQGTLGETYLIGTGDERSAKEVVELTLELMGKPTDWYEHVNDRPGHDMRYAMDSSKIRAELNWQPKFTNFREGLRATIEWYRQNEDWWKPAKEQVETQYLAKGQ